MALSPPLEQLRVGQKRVWAELAFARAVAFAIALARALALVVGRRRRSGWRRKARPTASHSGVGRGCNVSRGCGTVFRVTSTICDNDVTNNTDVGTIIHVEDAMIPIFLIRRRSANQSELAKYN